MFANFRRIGGKLSVRESDGQLIWKRGDNSIISLKKDDALVLCTFLPNPNDARKFIEEKFNEDGVYHAFENFNAVERLNR